MLSLITGFTQTSAQFINASLSLRTSYLLAGELRMIGNQHFLFDLAKYLKGLSYENKMAFISAQWAFDNTEEENKEDKEMMANYKKGKKLKNKSYEVLLNMETFERCIDRIFESYRTAYLQLLDQARLTELAPILQKNNVNLYNVNYDFPENETKFQSSLSKILQLSLDEEDEKHPIFIHLENAFFNDAFWQQYQLKMPSHVAHDSGFIIPILKPHNNLWLSVADMDALKNKHHQQLQTLQQTLNNFAPLATNVYAAHQHATHTIMPAAQALQQVFDEDPLIQGLCISDDLQKHPIQLYVGMLPWEMAWAYFEFTKMASPATMDALAAASTQNPFVPVTLLQVPDEVMPLLSTPPVTVQQHVMQTLPRKKEIIID